MNRKVLLPLPTLSDLKLGAGKRLGRFCLFCGVDLPHKVTKPRLKCKKRQCAREHDKAYKRDYQQDVFQTPHRTD